MNAVYMLGIIANRGIREKYIQFFRLHNIHVTLTVRGEGTAGSAILDYLGMEATGKTRLQYITAGQELSVEEESTLQNTDYELLITIANAGYIETLMDAARSADAPGGTVIHAKGTGAEHAKRFLGISLAEEKEMIFIVVRTQQKNAIMKAIMEQAGTKSPAGGIIFSLPVTSTAGLRMLEEES